jgi:hypothetical protein
MIAALVVAVLVTSLSAPSGIATPVQAAVVEAGSVLDSSGLRIVDAITQARPTNEAQAQALSDAFDLAEANPDDLGYPWIDPTDGTIELSAVSAKGDDIAAAIRAAMSQKSAVRHVHSPMGNWRTLSTPSHSLPRRAYPMLA